MQNLIQYIKRHTVSGAIISIFLLCCIFLILHYKDGKKSQPEGSPVLVAPVVQKDKSYFIDVPGVMEAEQTVDIKTQVSEKIIKINFQEGQIVKEGQVLFEIDSQNLIYQLNIAQANLAKDQVELVDAVQEEQRYSDLLKKKAVSQEQYSEMLTKRDSLKATIEADKGAIDNIKLQIQQCQIIAPIDGRIGETPYEIGSLVEVGSATPLATINKISPILVGFYVGESHLDAISNSKDRDKIEVVIKTRTGQEIRGGKITFIDNAINSQTGTIKIKALFENKDESLWTGQSVELTLNVSEAADALVIPIKALHTNQQGQYVFVANKDNIAELKMVSVAYADNSEAVITKGVNVGDLVVTEGALRLTQGSKLHINNTDQDTTQGNK